MVLTAPTPGCTDMGHPSPPVQISAVKQHKYYSTVYFFTIDGKARLVRLQVYNFRLVS